VQRDGNEPRRTRQKRRLARRRQGLDERTQAHFAAPCGRRPVVDIRIGRDVGHPLPRNCWIHPAPSPARAGVNLRIFG
jgi:hypothetical protein